MEEKGKPVILDEKNAASRSKERTTINSMNPHIMPGSGIENGTEVILLAEERSHQCAIPVRKYGNMRWGGGGLMEAGEQRVGNGNPKGVRTGRNRETFSIAKYVKAMSIREWKREAN